MTENFKLLINLLLEKIVATPRIMKSPLALGFCLITLFFFTYTASADPSSELRWSAPQGWVKQQPGMMVLESYQKATSSGELKLSISAFPGTVGGDLANVNRWLRQVGLDAVTETTLPTVLKQEVIADRNWKLVNLANDGNGMFVAYTLSGGKSWFFKITGPADGIASIQKSFKEFLATIDPKP